MLHRIPRATLLCLLLLGACTGRTTTTVAWAPVAATDLDQRQQAQAESALVARNAMMETLMMMLSNELATNGAAGAITVCKQRAHEVADTIADSQGVAIGRTSFKLRNPHNSAPAWAATLLEDRPLEPRFSASEEGALGVTLPILLQAKCLGCHGDPEAMPEEIRGALAEQYPDDQATGFAEGDLRGWFWVEVPALQP